MSADPRTDPQSTVPVEPPEEARKFWEGTDRKHPKPLTADEEAMIRGYLDLTKPLDVIMARIFATLDAARASQPITATERSIEDFATDLRPMIRVASEGPFDWAGPVDDIDSWLAETAKRTTDHGDAQPGAWIVQSRNADDTVVVAFCGNGPQADKNAELIAFLLNNAPRLAAIPVREDEPTGIDVDPKDPLWFLDKAREWSKRGFLTADQYGAICAVAFIQMPEDMTPEDRAAAVERGRQLAAEHPEWASHVR